MTTYIEKPENIGSSARVYDFAQVYDYALVCGSARVYGSARVCESAQVYGSARVYDFAQVYGSARVCDSARVYGFAQVFGSARVYGSARVCGSAQVYGILHGGIWEKSPFFAQGQKHALSQCSPNSLHIGCECRSIENWKSNAAEIGKAHGYNDEEIEFYLKLINLLL